MTAHMKIYVRGLVVANKEIFMGFFYKRSFKRFARTEYLFNIERRYNFTGSTFRENTVALIAIILR